MSEIRTIDIKGKKYVMVVDRVKEFHVLHPYGEITTDIESNDEVRVIVKATVKIPQILKKTGGSLVTEEMITRTFTGYSQAEWGKGMMGGVALEVAETSAIGRALGFANIGLLDGIASADEMRKVKKVKVGEAEGDDDLGF